MVDAINATSSSNCSKTKKGVSYSPLQFDHSIGCHVPLDIYEKIERLGPANTTCDAPGFAQSITILSKLTLLDIMVAMVNEAH